MAPNGETTAARVDHSSLARYPRDGEQPEAGVVDETLRVFGVKRPRIARASIFPGMIGGKINAAVIIAAKKAADRIRR